MKVVVLPLGPYQTNCYVVYDEETKKCVVTDPGFSGSELVKYLQDEGYTPEAVLLTHAHSDHIGGVQALLDTFSIPLYIHAGDVPKLSSAKENLSANMGLDIRVHTTPTLVQEGDELSHAGITFRVIETPGHTAGGVCYYVPEGLLLAGDTLFAGSIGRTDFPDGNHAQLIENIVSKLYTLPEDTIVCPGHGPQSTIGEEKANNPFTR